MEAVKITVLLFDKKNGQSTGGGKRIDMGEIVLDEEVNAFFEECMKEDEQKSMESRLDNDKPEKAEPHTEQSSKATENIQREKISVEELGKVERTEKKAPTSKEIERTEKQTPKTMEKETVEKERAKGSVANTSILAEMTILTQDKEEDEPSPFPIFKPNPENKPAVQSKEELGLETGKNQMEPTRDHGEKLDKDILAENEQDKSPFPVFNKEEVDLTKPLEPTEKTEGKEVKQTKPDKEVFSFEGINAPTEIIFEEEKMLHALSEISEENKLRLARHDQMTKEELKAIISTIKESAKVIMEQEEQAWREKISIEQGDNLGQSSSKIIDNTQNNISSKKELKK
jgi:hypothetical protein